MSISQKIFLAILPFVCITFSPDNANAVARLGGTCIPLIAGQAPGTGIDGSNCDPGTVCDNSITCVYPNESGGACSLSFPCGVGSKCFRSDGRTMISAPGEFGLCVASIGNAENNAFGDVLCNLFRFITGKVGRGVAAGAVIALGVFFFMGKVTWGSALAVALGVGAVFGAPAVVSVLTGKTFNC